MAKVTGAVSIPEGIAAYTNRCSGLVADAAEAAAEHIIGVSQELVPLKEGPLMNSGRVVRGVRYATIQYDTPYAVYQHEREDLRHAPGRQAHYLSQPMRTEADTAREIMAAVLRRAAR